MGLQNGPHILHIVATRKLLQQLLQVVTRSDCLLAFPVCFVLPCLLCLLECSLCSALHCFALLCLTACFICFIVLALPCSALLSYLLHLLIMLPLLCFPYLLALLCLPDMLCLLACLPRFQFGSREMLKSKISNSRLYRFEIIGFSVKANPLVQ